MRLLIAGLPALFLVATPVHSQQGEAPPPPQVDTRGAESPVDPDITILEEEDRVLYEYRDNEGRLYMVKVVPSVGRPYYLLDTDGDGEPDVRQDDPRKVAVNLWELLRW